MTPLRVLRCITPCSSRFAMLCGLRIPVASALWLVSTGAVHSCTIQGWHMRTLFHLVQGNALAVQPLLSSLLFNVVVCLPVTGLILLSCVWFLLCLVYACLLIFHPSACFLDSSVGLCFCYCMSACSWMKRIYILRLCYLRMHPPTHPFHDTFRISTVSVPSSQAHTECYQNVCILTTTQKKVNQFEH